MATVKISSLRGTGSGGSDISVVGPTTVLAGTTNTYTITDYDDFSVYDVSVNIGTVSRNDETITLVAPSGSGENVIILSISRDSNSRVFQIGLGGVGVATPSITSPTNGNTNIPTSLTIQATAFSTVPTGSGVQTASVWQVARDLGFTDLVVDETKTTGNLTQYSVSGLARNTTYYVRVKYQSSVGDSSWSSAISFTTTQQQINQPTVSIVGQDFNVGETPTFNSSAFSVTPAGSDTHVASTWIVRRADDDSVVWQLVGSSTNKLSVTIPAGVLTTSESYTMEVQHIGGFGTSVFSDKLTFTTAENFFPQPGDAGVPFGGGYYAGANIMVGPIEYALVVAPKTLGGEAPGILTWKISAAATVGTDSVNDGWENTQAMATAGLANHPAAQFCRGLSIGGFNDWYLPAKDELEILYRNFKPSTQSNFISSGANSNSVPPQSRYTSGNPAQTSVDLFKAGAAEAFQSSYYWSSTQGSPTTAWYQRFTDGLQTLNTKTDPRSVRAVRRVQVTPPNETPGFPRDGGYYAGKIQLDDGVYAIIISPKAEGEATLACKTTNTETSGTSSVRDGWANTLSMMAADAAAHPAANFCRNLTIGGYSDWYLPARDELEILYRYLKPTTEANHTSSGANSSSVPPTSDYTSGNPSQTSVALFKEGGAEAFTTVNYHWSSTESSSLRGWHQYFSNGNQNASNKTTALYVRAVRRVKIS